MKPSPLLVFCLACALDEDKMVQAYLRNRKQFVIFDDVDVGLMIAGKSGENLALMGHVIRRANHKTYWEIHDEIRSIQAVPVTPGRGMPTWFRSAMLLPWPLSNLTKALLVKAVRRNQAIPVSMGGTVALTSIGMFGRSHSGWGLTPTGTSLGLVVAVIDWKPTVVTGRIEPREILSLTVSFDHDIVDGGLATRFVRRLVELIESGHGLEATDILGMAVTRRCVRPTLFADKIVPNR